MILKPFSPKIAKWLIYVTWHRYSDIANDSLLQGIFFFILDCLNSMKTVENLEKRIITYFFFFLKKKGKPFEMSFKISTSSGAASGG